MVIKAVDSKLNTIEQGSYSFERTEKAHVNIFSTDEALKKIINEDSIERKRLLQEIKAKKAVAARELQLDQAKKSNADAQYYLSLISVPQGKDFSGCEALIKKVEEAAQGCISLSDCSIPEISEFLYSAQKILNNVNYYKSFIA